MKTLLLAGTVLLSALIISPTAAADSWRHNSFGYDRHRSWNAFPSYNRNHYRNNYRSSYRRGYRNSYFSASFGRHRPHYGHYRRHHGHHIDAGVLLGGLVLGSVITNSIRDYNRPRYETVRYRTRPVVRTRTVGVSRPVTVSRPATTSNRRLLRDLNGNCFEITHNGAGDEVRVQVDRSQCSF